MVRYIHIEGFESAKTPGELSHRYPTGTAGTMTFPAGRLHGSAMFGDSAATQIEMTDFVLGGRRYWYICGAWFINAPFNNQTIMELLTVGGSSQFRVRALNKGGGAWSLTVQRDGGPVIQESATFPGSTGGMWYFIEVFVDCATTATGAVTVRVNENVEIAATNVQTVLNALPEKARYIIRDDGSGGNASMGLDDLYLIADSINEGFQGDKVVEALLPNGDGDVNDMAVTGAASNFQAVDEPNENDGDTSYVSTTADEDQEWYEYQDLQFINGNIDTVFVRCSARLASSGSRNIAQGVRNVADAEIYETPFALNQVPWTNFNLRLSTNPHGGSPWLVSEINAYQFGFKTAT